jgi:hypothetical protein
MGESVYYFEYISPPTRPRWFGFGVVVLGLAGCSVAFVDLWRLWFCWVGVVAKTILTENDADPFLLDPYESMETDGDGRNLCRTVFYARQGTVVGWARTMAASREPPMPS